MSPQTQSLSATDVDWEKVATRGYHDPLFFNKYILGYDKLTGPIHGEMLRALQLYDKLGLYYPREHFKTTNVTEGYLLWRIVRNRNIRILINHKPYKEGRGYVQVIRDHLEHNPVLKHCYGNFARKGGRWGDDQFTVSGRTEFHHEQTVQLASPEHDPTGGHFNIIDCDDIVGLKDRYSEAARAQTRRFFKSLWALLLSDGQFIDIGTMWHVKDAHSTEVLGVPTEMIPRREDFFVRRRSAELPDGGVYFPEQFDTERLAGLKLGMGAALYSSQMLNTPMAEGLKRFDVDKFHFYEPDRLPDAARKAAYIDPATGEDLDKGCYTAMIVGYLANQQVYVPAAVLINEPFDAFKPRMIRLLKDHNVRTLYVEAVAFQTFFARSVVAAIKEAGLKVRVHKVKQTINKIERIDAMEPLCTSGQAVFRSDWDTAYPLLIAQLGDFPGGAFVDGPDCLEGLLAALLGRKRISRGVFFPPPPK